MSRKNILFTVSLFLVLLLGLSLYIATSCQSYSIYIPEPEGTYYSDVDIKYSDQNIASHSEPTHENGYLKLTFNALQQGKTKVFVACYNQDPNADIAIISNDYSLNVGIFNILYENKGSNIPNISAYPAIYITLALFFCIMAVYMIINFRKNLKKNMYSYNTILNCSFMIIFIGLGVFFIATSIYLLLNYRGYQMHQIHYITTMFLFLFILLSVPFVFIYAISMTISNISLIRHEGFRIANALGIAISITMILGVFLCIVFPIILSYTTYIILNSDFLVIYSMVSSVYIFLEVYLLATKICGLIAAKHKPAFDKDYIIILGCGIKKDGTLLPLLKGRVDKAIDFYYQQFKATGKKAIFVPSGGQGSDEIISEGEAMKRYLLEQGIPSEQIMPETKSTNTLENMKFSKELIGNENANIAFSTTNYHVFRSGILSNQAGLKAEGMGSKTKWYFWPNAFIREFVGLLVNQKIKIIIITILIILISAFSTMLI